MMTTQTQPVATIKNYKNVCHYRWQVSVLPKHQAQIRREVLEQLEGAYGVGCVYEFTVRAANAYDAETGERLNNALLISGLNTTQGGEVSMLWTPK